MIKQIVSPLEVPDMVCKLFSAQTNSFTVLITGILSGMAGKCFIEKASWKQIKGNIYHIKIKKVNFAIYTVSGYI